MNTTDQLTAYLKANPHIIGKVVDFDINVDHLYQFDLTANNTELNPGIFADTEKFSNWINKKLRTNNCKFAIGGYMEHRTIYARSKHFDADDEPRRLHLGIDIWGKAGTSIYAPVAGTVHSFNDNNNFGDYGPTIILEHKLGGLTLYTLYGHLSRKSLESLNLGMPVAFNQKLADFGEISENGHWPPHLHFQLIFDMEGNRGDYPGVCRYSEKDKYLKNNPDPQLLLNMR